MVCEWGLCAPPVPPGSPCNGSTDCSPAYARCEAETSFTCQPKCRYGPGGAQECPDGTPCEESSDCGVAEPVIGDTCSVGLDGPIGCRENRWCVMTTVGVRRCMPRCDPNVEGYCQRDMCLPDPDSADPNRNVCWRGGFGGIGDYGMACASHYDCVAGGCSPEGVCVPLCVEGSCAFATRLFESERVCVDGLCVPEGS